MDGESTVCVSGISRVLTVPGPGEGGCCGTSPTSCSIGGCGDDHKKSNGHVDEWLEFELTLLDVGPFEENESASMEGGMESVGNGICVSIAA